VFLQDAKAGVVVAAAIDDAVDVFHGFFAVLQFCVTVRLNFPAGGITSLSHF
jgi:hypothetical protein